MELELRRIKKSYQTKSGRLTALSDVDWHAASGRVHGVLGPNGSGKTSMVRIILDLLRPDSGTVLINGKSEGNRTDEFRSRLGYLPEERGLYRRDKVIDVLIYFGLLKGLPRTVAKERAQALLKDFEIADFATAPVQSLSKGMGQKVQLILTILHEPKLLILDEPFSGLDPINVRVIRDTILRFKAAGALVLLCTHRMDEAERLCDDILMLHRGVVTLSGAQRDLRERVSTRKVRISAGLALDSLTSVSSVRSSGALDEVSIAEDAELNDFLKELSARGINFGELHITPASLEDLYVSAVKNS